MEDDNAGAGLKVQGGGCVDCDEEVELKEGYGGSWAVNVKAKPGCKGLVSEKDVSGVIRLGRDARGREGLLSMLACS